MKKLHVLLAFTFIFIFCSTQAFADTWEIRSIDLKRAIPNDTNPPERLEPVTNLAPLDSSEGIIRRVKLREPEKKLAALTFDMCELETITTGCDMKILTFLREKNIPATLFMGGKWMRTHSQRVKEIMASEIFEIANHNWSHGNCALLSEWDLKNQILWTQAQFEILREELLRENPDLNPDSVQRIPKLFRLPYGRNSEKSLRIIANLGLRIIQWDVAAENGDNSKISRAKKSARLVASMTRPGSILLFHANLVPKGSDVLLREVVRELEAKNYAFVTVSELLEAGIPETTRSGYFTKPGDNIALDKKFGIDGTGRRAKAKRKK